MSSYILWFIKTAKTVEKLSTYEKKIKLYEELFTESNHCDDNVSNFVESIMQVLTYF
jgi:hypothetical protein